jgi:hypothetical protein
MEANSLIQTLNNITILSPAIQQEIKLHLIEERLSASVDPVHLELI